MPRIRKKTSARQKTRDRAKVDHKVKEWKKKSKRDSKRNPTWKSKKKADPGVPNSFHLKDQVLAELANEKRLSIEQREARRLAQKAAAKAQVDVDEEDDDKDVPGISSVASSVFTRPAHSGTSTLPVATPTDVPDLIDTDLPTLQAAIDRADVLLEMVDARDVLGGRSSQLEELFKESGGRVILVINKIDLVPREALQAWITSSPLPTFLTSTVSSLGITELRSALKAWSSAKRATAAESFLTVSVLGLPNVGKSSLVNLLVSKPTLKVAIAGSAASAKNPQPTTSAPVEVEVDVDGEKIHIIDTPGWEFVEDDDEDEDESKDDETDEIMSGDEDDETEKKWDELEARVAGDLLRRNLGRVDRVKDVFPLVNYIVERSNSTDLMLVYNVPYFESGDIQAFLTGLARVNARVKKHGEPDLESAARILLRDWAMGTFPYYSLPPTSTVTVAEQPDMSAVIAACRGKKEMKAAGRGLVRFRGGEVDQREVFLDDDYTEVDGEGVFHAAEDDEDEEEFKGFDDEDEDEDEDDEDDEEKEEEDEELIIGSEDGEVLDLPSGTEPSSGSDLEDDEDEDEEEDNVSVSSKRRRSRSASPARKRTKTVVFPRNLVAPRSVANSSLTEADIRPILKRPRESIGLSERAPPAKRKGAIEISATKSASKSGSSELKKIVGGPKKETTETKSVKKIKTQPKSKSSSTNRGEEEPYDFSKHFF